METLRFKNLSDAIDVANVLVFYGALRGWGRTNWHQEIYVNAATFEDARDAVDEIRRASSTNGDFSLPRGWRMSANGRPEKIPPVALIDWSGHPDFD